MIDDPSCFQSGPTTRGKYVPPHLRHCSTPTLPGSVLERPDYPATSGPVPGTQPPRPLTYLASPYSHPNPGIKHDRYKKATHAAAWLIRNMKWNVFAPITHSHPLATLGGLRGDWDFWKRIDEEYLSVTERLVVLELAGWRESVGVNAEIEIARKKLVEIVYMRPSASVDGEYDLAPYPMDELGHPGFAKTPRTVSEVKSEIIAENNARSAVTSKATTANPKDIVGSTKVSLSKVPAVALAHCAHAMMDGARKYDPYNWRAKAVQAGIYIDAAMRHILDWLEGEEIAPDSGVHHLGHAMACCAILLDCQENGCLIDDRPVTEKSKGVASRVFDRLREEIAKMPPVDRKKL